MTSGPNTLFFEFRIHFILSLIYLKSLVGTALRNIFSYVLSPHSLRAYTKLSSSSFDHVLQFILATAYFLVWNTLSKSISLVSVDRLDVDSRKNMSASLFLLKYWDVTFLRLVYPLKSLRSSVKNGFRSFHIRLIAWLLLSLV